MSEQYTTSQSDCESIRELIPAYALGFADPDEVAQVEALLPHCPELAGELAEYRALADVMMGEVPQVTPPPSLGMKILQAALPPFITPDAPPPVEVPTLPAATPANIPAAKPSRRRIIPLIAAAAAVLALVVLNTAVLLRTLAAQNELTSRLEAQTAMLALFAHDEVWEFELTDPQDADHRINAVVFCNPEETVGVIRAEHFPYQAAEYQVWLWRDGERTWGGEISIADDGTGLLIFEAPEPMKNYQYIGIGTRVEGSPALVRGPLYPPDQPPPSLSTPTPEPIS